MMLTVVLAWAVPPAPLQLSENVVALASTAEFSLPEVSLLPLHPPEAVQDVAFVDDHDNTLVPPLATLVGEADKLTVGAGVAAVTETDVDACVVPPLPVQLRLNVVFVLSAPVLELPEVDFVPLQPPDAEQDVAFVDDQRSVLLLPLVTDVGEADSETVGAGVGAVTETVRLACAEPPAPVHVSVYDAEAVNAPVPWLPDVAFVPLQLPDAEHEVALVEDHVSVLLPPLLTVLGDADSETVGACAGVEFRTDTEVLAWAVPPVPVQLSVKVVPVVKLPVLAEPDVARVPLQPPDAVQDVARVDDHVRVLELPLSTRLGEADNDTVGAVPVDDELRIVTMTLACAEPPAPVQVSVKDSVS